MSRLQVLVWAVLGLGPVSVTAALWVQWVQEGAQADREAAARCVEAHPAGRLRCDCLEAVDLRSGGNGHVAAARARACEALEVER